MSTTGSNHSVGSVPELFRQTPLSPNDKGRFASKLNEDTSLEEEGMLLREKAKKPVYHLYLHV